MVSSDRARAGSQHPGEAPGAAQPRRIFGQEKKMIDIQLLRNDIESVATRLATRGGFVLDAARFQELDARRKHLQQSVEAAQADRNRLAKEIGQAKAKKEDARELMEK